MSMLTDLQDAQQFYSDFHKSLYGFRPRPSAEQWMSLTWLEARIAELHAAAPAIEAEERESERLAIAAFETLVQNTMALGAGDRATAIRWLRDATGDDYAINDDGYFEYTHHLPYGYLRESNHA